jgi:hypothetical protein
MPSRSASKVGDTVSYRNAAGETMDVVIIGIQGAAPAAGDFTAVGGTVGGSLAAGNYSYKVTAVVNGVETPASVAEVGNVASGSTGIVTIDFTVGLASFPTATAWKVYGRTALGEELIATINAPTATYVDTGAVTPDGEPPEATGAIRFKNFGTKTVQTQIPMATASKQTGVYYNH